MSAAGIVVALALAGADADARLAIESDSSCPAADTVRAALARLTPAREDAAVSLTATPGLAGEEQRLTVVLAWPARAGRVSRVLTVGSDCASRAEAAALVIASWLGELPTQALPDPALAPPPLELRESRAVDPSPPAAPEPAARATELGAGLLLAAGGSWAPGVRLELARVPAEGGGFGLCASLAATTARDVALGPGLSRWTRVALAAGARARWAPGRVHVEGEAGPAAALALAWGEGYDVNEQAAALTWGLAGGARLALPWRRLRVWLDARALGWLRRQRVRNQMLPASAATVEELPAAEAQLTLGASYAFR